MGAGLSGRPGQARHSSALLGFPRPPPPLQWSPRPGLPRGDPWRPLCPHPQGREEEAASSRRGGLARTTQGQVAALGSCRREAWDSPFLPAPPCVMCRVKLTHPESQRMQEPSPLWNPGAPLSTRGSRCWLLRVYPCHRPGNRDQRLSGLEKIPRVLGNGTRIRSRSISPQQAF